MRRLLVGVMLALTAMNAARAQQPLPPGAIARLGDSRYRLAEGRAEALSPDGRLLVVVTPADAVIVYDLRTGRPAYRIDGLAPVPPVAQRLSDAPGRVLVQFTPDGKHLLTADRFSLLRQWDAATGKPVRTLSLPEAKAVPAITRPSEYTGKVTDLVACPGGKQFLVRSDRQHVFVLDPADGSMTYRGGDRDDILAVSGEGRLWVSHYNVDATHEDFNVMHDGKLHFSDTLPEGICGAALSVDARLAAGIGKSVKLWDLSKKAEIKLEKARWPRYYARFVTFTPDGKVLLVAGDDQDTVARWDTATGKRLSDLRANRKAIEALIVSADGKVLLTTGKDHVIRRFDLASGKGLPHGDGFTGRVTVALSPDGRLAAAGDEAGALLLWATPFTGAPRTLRDSGSAVVHLAFAADRRRLFTVQDDGFAGVWDLVSGKEVTVLQPPRVVPRATGNLLRVAVSPDDRRIAVDLWENKVVWAWDSATGKVEWMRPYGITEGWLLSAAFTPDSLEILIGLEYGVVARLDAASGREIGRFTIPGCGSQFVRGLAVSPDGSGLAARTSDNDTRLIFLDRGTGEALWRRDFSPEQALNAVLFAPSGAWLVTGHYDGGLRLWETATGKPALERTLPAGRIRSLQLSADGRLAVTDSPDATALVWSLKPQVPDGWRPEAAWKALAGADAAEAYQAAWWLADRLQEHADEVRKRLPPDRDRDPAAKLPGLLTDLDSPAFETREAASEKLTALLVRYPGLRPAVETAASSTTAPEVRRRLAEVLAATTRGVRTSDGLLRHRVLAAVELAGTPTARKLLDEWAAGTAASALTAEAKLALARLEKR
jgi:WD40 repeat protein